MLQGAVPQCPTVGDANAKKPRPSSLGGVPNFKHKLQETRSVLALLKVQWHQNPRLLNMGMINLQFSLTSGS